MAERENRREAAVVELLRSERYLLHPLHRLASGKLQRQVEPTRLGGHCYVTDEIEYFLLEGTIVVGGSWRRASVVLRASSLRPMILERPTD